MTDKQIIIDGVDVSGCKFFRNGICASPINPKCKLCVEISEKMCYYKQLKRLEFELRVTEADYKASEQECETLASQLDFEVQKKECLEQECERWKSNFNGKVSAIEELLKQLDQLKADRGEALKQLEFVRTLNTVKGAEIRKLSKTLAKIKEIAEDFYLDGEHVKDKYLAQEILQKISEAGNE